MAHLRETADIALKMLRTLPRVQLSNIRPNPNSKKSPKRGRAQHGGDKHGAGNKGSGQRQNYMRLGYETGNNPFYLRFPYEPYYKGHHMRRQYPPISLLQLQVLLDTNRIDGNQPIDLTTLCNTGLLQLQPASMEYGFQLTDEGIDRFKAKICIEVQHAKESVIAAIERNGGVIRTAYYDPRSLQAMTNPQKWFEKGVPIPKRQLPPKDAIEYYISAKNRGYLADPEEISKDRLVLAQKYGYELPRIEDDADYDMLISQKDPQQIFYGLEPGWVIGLKDKIIVKSKGFPDEQTKNAESKK
ncbi:39S ribosomal protein L15, mitochondrial [Anastrepha obliqua]|uniref:39S ribosomal protein L15, mitochondrial n=1 Tax=Anastrepha obliqua TaxID=95512 RepID=UPI002409ED64|nr:39S ribosomal protein L15, mitochondrial [Anastrepha obliqua]